MANPMATTARWAASHPFVAMSLVLLVTGGLGAGLSQADPGRISELFVPDNLEAQATLRIIETQWGAIEPAFLLYVIDDPSAAAVHRAIARDIERLEMIEGMGGVAGLTPLLQARLGDMDAATDQQIENLARQLIASPGGASFAADDALLLRIAMSEDVDFATAVIALDEVAATSAVQGIVSTTGTMHLEMAQQNSGSSDVGILMPLSIVILIGMLAILFRRVKDVAIPIVVSFFAIAMAYGTVAWAGLPLAPPSFIVMPLLLGLGVDYMLHVIYAFREAPVDQRLSERFHQAATEVGKPVLYTAITTLIGFGSFLASNVPQIRVWGLLIGSGALYAFILAFVAMPALYRVGRPRHKVTRLPLDGIMKNWSRFIIRWRTPVAIIALLVTSLLAVSASQINIESDLEFEIDETLPAVAAFAAIESRFGGQTLAQVLIDADRRADLETIEERLENAGTFQFIDGPIHRLQRQGDASGPLNGPGLAEVVSVDYWRIMVGYNEGDQRAIDDVQEAINGISGARLTGADIVQLESQEKVLDSLFLSTGIALALVLTLLFVVFRQPLIALLAFMPLPMILIWQLGLQQLFQIPLNPITGVISAMTLGIGVDYSLHIVAHYQAHRLEGHRAAARQALASVGRPVLAASITTVAAFSVLGLSSLVPLRQFGYTASIVIFSAFVLSLTFLPAMASFGGPAPTHTHAMHGAPIVRERPYVGPR